MTESSEDVNDFLLRIRELGDQRDREDEERTRKLEEEILQGRKERQARRAERARSISPTKDSPLASVTSLSQPDHDSILNPPQELKPSGDTALRDLPTLPKPESEETPNSGILPKASSLTTSRKQPDLNTSTSTTDGTQDLHDQSRGLYLPGRGPAESTNPSDVIMEDDTNTSRAQISRALGSKDPSWFRQTADRDRASLALRRNVEDSFSELPALGGGGFKLPGLSRNSTPEIDKPRDSAGERSRSPSRASSTLATSSVGYRYSSVSSVSTSGLGSPMPLSSQRLDSHKTETSPTMDERTPLSPERASPERSGSPTKGLGGFVQSAMMKRSDSISKRWSVQAPGSLSRSNSVISNRSSVSRSGFGDLLPGPADLKTARGTSPLSISRPGSSHSEATVVHQVGANEGKTTAGETPRADSGFIRPSLPSHARSHTMSSVGSVPDETNRPEPTTPRSPSKTMDPKRWSPTKASWLESALNRPESPRAKSTPAAQQPPWLRDLTKARQTKASVDLGKPAGLKEAAPTDLTDALVNPDKKPAVPGDSQTARLTSKESDSSFNVESAGVTPEDGQLEAKGAVQTENEPTVPESAQRSPSASKISPPVPANKPKLATRNDQTLLSPTLLSPKPKPGGVDLRANLRRRETAQGNTTQEEPEFKNVFGKLRKTEKSNYKAPDVLKDNIMKGKAALNVTGGPKKSDRVDEFKESILKQKEAMKTGAGSIRRPSEESRSTSKPSDTIPEAISKRNNLSRPESAKNSTPVLSPPPLKTTSAGSLQKTVIATTNKAEAKDSVSERSPALAPAATTSEVSLPSSEPLKQALELAVAVAAKPPQKDEINEVVQPVRPSKSFVGATKSSAAPKGFSAKGTLADRMNPALANALSRGPPRGSEETKKSPLSDLSTTSTTQRTSESVESVLSAPLTHMTKTRARGPKRRLPAGNQSDPQQPTRTEERPKSQLINQLETIKTEIEKIDQSTTLEKALAAPVPATRDGFVLPQTPGRPAVQPAKPRVASKSPELRKSLVTSVSDPNPIQKAQKAIDAKPSALPLKPQKGFGTPPKPDNLRQEATPDEDTRSLKDRPTPPPKSLTLPLSQSAGNSSPSPSFASKLKETLVNSANASPLQAKFGLGLGSSFFQSRPGSPLDRKSSQPDKVSASPPVPPKKNLTISPDVSNEMRRSSLTSPVPRTTESTNVIHDFFSTLPKSSDRVNIDPQLILTTETVYLKTRTIRKQIWEITGDGKKQDLPVNQEYILFEGSMYVCVHNFEDETGSRTEAYLWIGDEVSEAAMEDAQLFARRVARESGARLELVKQGKEPAKFIEALGGIIITRRGSSSRSSSSALYMLCGRRHLGQIVFDEVDLSRRNLCSGFPFVISAKFGKLYLWKGKGSGADEIGGARLIGMDLGLTGEIEEVCEGEEPESFFEVFSDARELQPGPVGDHWHLKPRHEKYRCRLLRLDYILGQKGGFWNRRGSSSPVTRPNDIVEEIEPFCQKDLRPREIYILDAFFEIYVVVGRDANSRPAEFASALVFAHEYGILAASLQDRPFIPRSFVSIGGIPECCQIVFRKWDPKVWQSTPRVLPLNAAIEAIRS